MLVLPVSQPSLPTCPKLSGCVRNRWSNGGVCWICWTSNMVRNYYNYCCHYHIPAIQQVSLMDSLRARAIFICKWHWGPADGGGTWCVCYSLTAFAILIVHSIKIGVSLCLPTFPLLTVNPPFRPYFRLPFPLTNYLLPSWTLYQHCTTSEHHCRVIKLRYFWAFPLTCFGITLGNPHLADCFHKRRNPSARHGPMLYKDLFILSTTVSKIKSSWMK